MAKGELLGRIDCSCCGLAKGLRVTEDKNGAPFGFCDAGCNYQMRIGGDAVRIDRFYALYPSVKRSGERDTKTLPLPDAVTEPPRKGGGLSDVLHMMGGGK